MSDRQSLEVGGEDTHPGPVEPFEDPGLPEHRHRLTDTDAKAARRAERQVAGMFGLSILATIGFIVAYVAIPLDGDLRTLQASNLWLGVALGVALLAIGVAAVHWARKLMPDVEVVAERHPLRPSEESRSDALEQWDVGVEESGFGRRSLIRGTMIGALALLPIPAVILLRDLGPLPGNDLSVTNWDQGMRLLTDPGLEPIALAGLEMGSLVNALPASFEEIPEENGAEILAARARDAVIVVRMPPAEVNAPAGRENWGIDGVLAYSKICTHVGCPISLYERTTHHLLCPCHQSTFQLNEGGRVIFGPAKRAMPQLAIETDDEGYLVAKLQGGFQEPVGPSFFERG